MIEQIQETKQVLDATSGLLTSLIGFLTAAISACSIIAAITPPPDPNHKFYPVLKVLDTIVDYIAFNFGKAKK